MSINKSRVHQDNETGYPMVSESALATAEIQEVYIPDDVAYANIVDGVLQISPDIEEDIAAVNRGEVISMTEFKTMFSKWLD